MQSGDGKWERCLSRHTRPSARVSTANSRWEPHFKPGGRNASCPTPEVQSLLLTLDFRLRSQSLSTRADNSEIAFIGARNSLEEHGSFPFPGHDWGRTFRRTANRCNYALSEIKSGHLPPPAVGFRRGSVQPNRQDLFVASRSVAAYVREFYSQAPATLHSDKHVHPHRTTNRRLGSRSPML